MGYEQQELMKQVLVKVPEEIGESREVQFKYENRTQSVVIPEGYGVNSDVPVMVYRKPFLEINRAHAEVRGHIGYLDVASITEQLRHPYSRAGETCSFEDDECKRRHWLYHCLRTFCSVPLLPCVAEE